MATRPWLPWADCDAFVEYFDPQFGITLTQSAVTQWAGRKGAIILGQTGTAAQCPTLGTTINGIALPTFDGAQTFLTAAVNVTAAAVNSVSFLQMKTGIPNYAGGLVLRKAGVQDFADKSSIVLIERQNGDPAYTSEHSSAAAVYTYVPIGTPAFVHTRFTGAVLSVASNGNAPSGSTNVTGAIASTILDMGCRFFTGNRSAFWLGPIGDTGITNRDLTQDEADRCVSYVLWKYGYQANIPSANPYKSAPPTVSTGGTTYPMAANGAAEYVGRVGLTERYALRGTGAAEIRGSSSIRLQTAVRPSGATEYQGRTAIQKLGLIRPAGASEFTGAVTLKSLTDINSRGASEYTAGAALRRWGQIKTIAATEFASQTVLKGQIRILTSPAASEYRGTAGVKPIQGIRVQPAAMEVRATARPGVQTAVRARAAAEYAGAVSISRAALLYTRGVAEYHGSARVTFRGAIRPRAASEYVGTAGILAQAKIDRNSIYGNLGAPYGYGPYGQPFMRDLAPAGASEFYGATVVRAQTGYQPALYYAGQEYAGKASLAVQTVIRPRQAVMELSGRARASVGVAVRVRAGFEYRTTGRVTIRFGLRAVGGLSLAARVQISYAWSDLSYPSRPQPDLWGMAASPVDPWQIVRVQEDTWQTARPVPEK